MSHQGQGNYFDTTFNINGKRELSRATSPRGSPKRRRVDPEAAREAVLPDRGSQGASRSVRPRAEVREAFDATEIKRPATEKDTGDGKPDWVRQRVTTWHGIDGPIYKACGLSGYDEFVRAYYGAILSVDDSLGEITEALRAAGTLDNTLVIFTTDNGFLLGEHGAIDKRAMWEESIRVPMIVRYPPLIRRPAFVNEMVLHIDLAPDDPRRSAARGRSRTSTGRRGRRLLAGDARAWRTSFLYEYNYEKQFPYTPNVRAHADGRLEVHPLPARRRQPRSLDGGALRPEGDPLETKNLIGDRRRRVVRNSMGDAAAPTDDDGRSGTMPIDEGSSRRCPRTPTGR
jgi:N-acetylglucosamine-6-sulfatase